MTETNPMTKIYLEVPQPEQEGVKTVKVIATYDGPKTPGLCSVLCTSEILPLVRYNWGQGNLDHWINTEAYYYDTISILEYKTPNTHTIEIRLKYPPSITYNDYPIFTGSN
jgi:hypothetical protein